MRAALWVVATLFAASLVSATVVQGAFNGQHVFGEPANSSPFINVAILGVRPFNKENETCLVAKFTEVRMVIYTANNNGENLPKRNTQGFFDSVDLLIFYSKLQSALMHLTRKYSGAVHFGFCSNFVGAHNLIRPRGHLDASCH